MSDALHFAEHRLQEISLIIMGLVYITRLVWLFRFKAGKERQMATGLPNTNKRKGILYSWVNIMTPWAMESTRKHYIIYAQFVIFHLAVTCSILLSFFIPYAPGLLEISFMVLLFQVIIGVAFLIGLYRMYRRLSKPVMRAISTPDDLFSLTLITIWMGFAFFAVPNDTSSGETVMLTYFWLTAFFLIYVPFSKISHYLYYPITRYYFGKTMGHRGSYPLRGTRV